MSNFIWRMLLMMLLFLLLLLLWNVFHLVFVSALVRQQRLRSGVGVRIEVRRCRQVALARVHDAALVMLVIEQRMAHEQQHKRRRHQVWERVDNVRPRGSERGVDAAAESRSKERHARPRGTRQRSYRIIVSNVITA